MALQKEFPALARAGTFVFFDNAAGAQVPQAVFDAVNGHMLERMVQRGGRYPQSIEVDAVMARARQSVGALVNARSPNEIAFGMNATSFIRQVSLAIGQQVNQGVDERNEFILTDLDHEANIATWLALEPLGATFRWWKLRDDGCLHLEDLQPLLSKRTRLVACAVAANSLGTLVDVRGVADAVHAAGGEVFLDCVHFGPHGRIDVQAFDCDYLVCSGYKIFAPHMGFLWGRYELLQRLPTFREDFIPNEPPGKIEAGTVPYESVAGMDAAVQYLARLGRSLSGRTSTASDAAPVEDLSVAMDAIHRYEQKLSIEMLSVLRECGAQIYGVCDAARVAERVPTFCFNLKGVLPADVVNAASKAGFGIRDGHMYSPRLMKRLSLPLETGAVRASLVHYNTVEEIQRFGNVIAALARHR